MSTCRDVMTREPACCQPTDSLVRVAQTMKSEDVGAIPIVEGSSRQLVGMVTDRDIVVKALAAGRSTRTDDGSRGHDHGLGDLPRGRRSHLRCLSHGGAAGASDPGGRPWRVPDGDHRAGRCRDSGSQGSDDRRTGGSDLRARSIATVANRLTKTDTKQSSSVATGRARSVAAREIRAI